MFIWFHLNAKIFIFNESACHKEQERKQRDIIVELQCAMPWRQKDPIKQKRNINSHEKRQKTIKGFQRPAALGQPAYKANDAWSSILDRQEGIPGSQRKAATLEVRHN